MEDSIFTKIIKREIPAEIIYEDDSSIVILDIEPLTPGHLLVIPKEQIDHIWDLPQEVYQHLMSVTKQVASLLREAYDYERIAIVVEGFGVPHAHVHVSGLNEGLEPTIIRHAATKRPATPEELKIEADKIRAAL